MYLLKVWIVWISPSTAKPTHFCGTLGFPDFSQQGRCEAGRKGQRRGDRKEGWYQVPLPPGVGGMKKVCPHYFQELTDTPTATCESQSRPAASGRLARPPFLP